MKNIFKIIGIILIAAIIGFSFMSCKLECDDCGGSGDCRLCDGTGTSYYGYFPCDYCDNKGSGSVGMNNLIPSDGKCKTCHGEGKY